VRELEEETGAVCISKAAAMEAQENGTGVGSVNGATSAIATGSEPGPSNRPIPTKRHPTKVKTLPDFFLGGYDAALRAAQRDARVLCVVITSEEHDDVPEFRRNVLTDPEFVKTITDNHIIVWGGDVRDRDGYQGKLIHLLFW
jgi:FAS-associated factor 2